jgi:uncharacterized protein with FMN-binding domain
MHTTSIKSLTALALTGVGSVLVVGFQTPDAPVLASTATSGTTATTAPATTAPAATSGTTAAGADASGSASTPSATATPSTTTTDVAAAATYADGTWTGEAVQEPWGTFQVQAVVSGGQLTDVVLVQAPQDGHSSRINSQAVPMLTQAAVAAQSASINMLSGATWTSDSYITSLQAALDQAAAAAQNGA